MKSSFAVIDIGSNSVRLVVYDYLHRVPMVMYNEKVLCGLAKNLDKTGKLHVKGVELAMSAIGRFVTLSSLMKVGELVLFATAAVREAKDGNDFLKNIYHFYQKEVEILSGEQEALYAGYGAVSGIPEADGVVGDLGGGSLELIGLKSGVLEETAASFPIGALRLLSFKKGQEYEHIVDKYLKKFPLRELMQNKSFYAVGGSFRNLAKLHISRKGYELKVLHNYAVHAEEFMETLHLISRMSAKAIAKLPGCGDKRGNILPVAATIARHILEIGCPRYVVFSVFGVREGYIFNRLKQDIKNLDPLIEGAKYMAGGLCSVGEYAKELEVWMRPLFPKENEKFRKLCYAACILSEISRYENTEYRASLAYQRIVDSTLSGIRHEDRAFIAAAVYFRYQERIEPSIFESAQYLLPADHFVASQKVGYIIRLARCLSGSVAEALQYVSINKSDTHMILRLAKEQRALRNDRVNMRLESLAGVFDLKSKVVLM